MTQCSISKNKSKHSRIVATTTTAAHAAYAQFLQFSLVSAAGNGILCALFDAAAVIRRQLSTILLETCTPRTSLPPHPSPLASLPSLSRLLLATNCINGQRAPFWVAFKVVFHFIAISIFNWFCFISRFMCVFLFCCAQTRTHTQWENAICCAFFWFSFAIAVCRLLIANCLVSLTLWLRSVLAVYLASQSGQPGQPTSQLVIVSGLICCLRFCCTAPEWPSLAWLGLARPARASEAVDRCVPQALNPFRSVVR